MSAGLLQIPKTREFQAINGRSSETIRRRLEESKEIEGRATLSTLLEDEAKRLRGFLECQVSVRFIYNLFSGTTTGSRDHLQY